MTAKRRFAHSLNFILCIYSSVIINMAKYGSRRSQLPENVNFEPIIRGLKSDLFDWGQVYIYVWAHTSGIASQGALNTKWAGKSWIEVNHSIQWQILANFVWESSFTYSENPTRLLSTTGRRLERIAHMSECHSSEMWRKWKFRLEKVKVPDWEPDQNILCICISISLFLLRIGAIHETGL